MFLQALVYPQRPIPLNVASCRVCNLQHTGTTVLAQSFHRRDQHRPIPSFPGPPAPGQPSNIAGFTSSREH